MSLFGIAPPNRLSGLPELVQRQFNEWFQWLDRLVIEAFGLFVPVRMTGASNEIIATHVSKYLIVDNAAATTLTLNANVLAAMPLGAPVYMVQAGTGQLTLSPSGVTVRTAETLKTRKQWSSMMLVKVDTAEAILNGDLELA